ncbi:VUT family protein [uncultured Treponema sp.]|uniref:VUT family protein n=1 Tax=uncultured Treponema sp. TaxID=162155 RepID=UPI002582DF44|nr:VUT family protein [uncultured Treponema sp.]
MKKFLSFVSREASDFKILLRNIPSLTVSIFILSVVCANLMANKELVTFKYAALDCGFAFSWIMFLCMDVICKRWGAKASIKISLVALAANLFICVSFALLAKTPGKWGEYYASENLLVNDALNATFAGSWYVVLGSSVAFVSSSVVNALLNCAIGSLFKSDGFFSFASRSYISTAIAQLVDNFIFATIVSKVFFGWTWIQVFVCSAIGAGFELLGEVFFSGLGYKVVRQWEKERVGQEYIEYKKANAK